MTLRPSKTSASPPIEASSPGPPIATAPPSEDRATEVPKPSFDVLSAGLTVALGAAVLAQPPLGAWNTYASPGGACGGTGSPGAPASSA